jgi:hypothetical protein
VEVILRQPTKTIYAKPWRIYSSYPLLLEMAVSAHLPSDVSVDDVNSAGEKAFC